MERPPPKSSSEQLPAHSAALFPNARNIIIYGGEFTAAALPSARAAFNSKDPFQYLQEHVATSAFHSSARRVDPPRCHENTRMAVLDEIFEWITQETTRMAWILWLNGAAGAGKTAIGQSVAELCVARGILVASFFFFRRDPTRNSIKSLASTLAYQLIQLVPEVKAQILDVIESNPLIFQQGLEAQLDALIVRPLRRLRLSDPNWRVLFLIDGVDECDDYNDQMNLIRTIAKVLSAKNVPIVVMFGSRTENHLKMAFNSPKVSNILLRMPLDDQYLPDKDIHLFLDDGFRDIKQTHPFSHLIAPAWPGATLVQDIVDKSSGQFIYAAVVMKFVTLPNAHPAQQLEIVRGLRPTGHATPFAQLDALYRHIFSCVQNIQLITTLLAFVILAQNTDIEWMALFFDITPTDVHVALAALASVITCEESTLRVLHASLADFLLDPARSQEYHINPTTWGTQLAIQWYTNMAAGRSQGVNYNATILNLLKHAQCGPELLEAILAFKPDPVLHTDFFGDYLPAVQRLDFGDGGELYRQQLNMIIRFIRKVRPDDKDIYYLDKRDIVEHIVGEIAREEHEHDLAERMRAEREAKAIQEIGPHVGGSHAHETGRHLLERNEKIDSEPEKALPKPSLRSRLKARLGKP